MDCVTVNQVRRVRSGHSVGRGEERHPRPGLLPCDHPPGGWTTGVGQTRGGIHCLQRRPFHQLLRVPYACGRLSCIIGGNCHKYHFCRDKTCLLSQQTRSFVSTSVLLSGQKTCFVFVATKICLSRQNYVCRDKYLS